MILLAVLIALFGGRAVIDLPMPDLPEMQAGCEADGGTLVAGRSGAYQCLLPQADEGQTCTSASDCTGYCIGGDVPDHGSYSRYPVGPGCTAFLNDTGAEVTICVD